MKNLKHCTKYTDELPELLLDEANAPAELKAHAAVCVDCQAELESLSVTFAMMDEWSAPEPSEFFDVRMAARLREERAAQPAGWYENLRARFQFFPAMQMRGVMTGALATLILIGGGAFAGLSPQPQAPSAAVTDLRIMDRNDKALDQMDQLLQADNDTGTASDTTANP